MKQITLSFLKTARGKAYLEKNSEMLVFINTDNGRWMKNNGGYSEQPHNWGIYTLKEAYDATSHCGPEKYARYFPITIDHFTSTLQMLSDRQDYLIKAFTQFLQPKKK